MSIDLKGEWIALGITIIVNGLALHRAWILSNIKIDQQKESIDGLGKRLNANELSCKENSTNISTILAEQGLARQERSTMQTDLANLSGKVDEISKAMRSDNVAVTAMIYNSERTLLQKISDLDKHLSRVDERLNIQSIVRGVAREIVDEIRGDKP